jgi:hypothetical protein
MPSTAPKVNLGPTIDLTKNLDKSKWPDNLIQLTFENVRIKTVPPTKRMKCITIPPE